MPYCTDCGVEVGAGDSFCKSCGTELDSGHPSESGDSRRDRGTEPGTGAADGAKRISLSLGRTTERHYNLDSICYLKYNASGFSTYAYVLLVGGIGLLIGASEMSGVRSVAPVGMTLVLAAWFVVRPDDGLAIGSLASRDTFSIGRPGEIRREFLDKTPENLSIEGSIDSFLYDLDYQYHFVVENLVSVEKAEAIFSPRPLLLTILGVLLTATLGVVLPDDPSHVVLDLVIVVSAVGHLSILAGGAYPLYRLPALVDALDGARRVVYAALVLLLNFFAIPIFSVWLHTWNELHDSSFVAGGDGHLASVSDMAATVAGVAVLHGLAVGTVLVALPRAGVVISLPNHERLRFRTTEEDAERLVRRFMQEE